MTTQATFDQQCRDYAQMWDEWKRAGLTDTRVCREMGEAMLSLVRRRYGATAHPVPAAEADAIRREKRDLEARAEAAEDAWLDREGELL